MPLPLVPVIIAGVVAATQFNGAVSGFKDASEGQTNAMLLGRDVNEEIGKINERKSPVKAFIDGLGAFGYLPAIELTKAFHKPEPLKELTAPLHKPGFYPQEATAPLHKPGFQPPQ